MGKTCLEERAARDERNALAMIRRRVTGLGGRWSMAELAWIVGSYLEPGLPERVLVRIRRELGGHLPEVRKIIADNVYGEGEGEAPVRLFSEDSVARMTAALL